MTRIEKLLRRRGLKKIDLIRESRRFDARPDKRGYSRNHIYGVCAGDIEPTRQCMDTLVATIQYLANDRDIRVEDVFEFAASSQAKRKAS